MYPETDYRLGQRAAGNAQNRRNESLRYQQESYARQQAMDDQREEFQRAQAQASANAFYGYGLGSGSSYQRTNTSPPHAALPGPAHWSVTLGVSTKASVGEIKAAYRRLAVKAHPDHGGSTEAMAKLNTARDQAIRERKAA